jgi:hypothetical protein
MVEAIGLGAGLSLLLVVGLGLLGVVLVAMRLLDGEG